jgi:N-acetyl-gamma-glutamyl-phosphate reductase
MIKAGIIGGAGYTGLELIRLLLMHPEVEIAVVTSRRHKGEKVSTVNPHLHPFITLEYEDVVTAEIADRSDIVFVAVPHGSAMDYVPQLMANGARVIDLSADYRLKKAEYERIYKREHKLHTACHSFYKGLTHHCACLLTHRKALKSFFYKYPFKYLPRQASNRRDQ